MATQVSQSFPTKRLAAAILSTDGSFTVNNIQKWSGTNATSADFGTRAFGCFRNAANTQIEFFEFDPTTISSSAITIVARGLDYKGGTTASAETKYTWPANSTLVELGGNVPALFEQYVDKTSAETITGVKTFATGATPIITDAPVSGTDAVNKTYADGLAIAGAPDGADAVKGIYERATIAEIENNTSAGSTTAPLAITSGRLGARLYTAYAADAGANDTYAITCSPAPTQYSTGMVITFKANTANTGACTVNVNGLGAKSLKVNKDLDPQDGYIKAGAIITAIYDGTNFQIQSESGKPSVSQSGTEIYGGSFEGSDTYVVTLAPIPSAYTTGMTVRFLADVANTGAATLNVNSLGAKSILRPNSSALANGDIASGQIVELSYDGTNFIMLSPVANAPKYNSGSTNRDMSSTTTTTIAHGLGCAPRKVTITVAGKQCMSAGYFDGTNQRSVWNGQDTNGSVSVTGEDTTHAVHYTFGSGDGSGSSNLQGAVSVDATNITITWTKNSSPTGTGNILWEAEA